MGTEQPGQRNPEQQDTASSAALGESNEFALGGVWHSHYTYESTGRGPITRHHYVVIRQEGDQLTVESLPGSNDSPVSLSLNMRGPIGTGTWTEHTAVDGYYQGAVYHGALQVIVDSTGRSMSGKWVGFDKELHVDSGPWALDLVDVATDEATLERYNRSPLRAEAERQHQQGPTR